jgi:hypothetical protein
VPEFTIDQQTAAQIKKRKNKKVIDMGGQTIREQENKSRRAELKSCVRQKRGKNVKVLEMGKKLAEKFQNKKGPKSKLTLDVTTGIT